MGWYRVNHYYTMDYNKKMKPNRALEVVVGVIGYIVGMGLGVWFLVSLVLYKG